MMDLYIFLFPLNTIIILYNYTLKPSVFFFNEEDYLLSNGIRVKILRNTFEFTFHVFDSDFLAFLFGFVETNKSLSDSSAIFSLFTSTRPSLVKFLSP